MKEYRGQKFGHAFCIRAPYSRICVKACPREEPAPVKTGKRGRGPNSLLLPIFFHEGQIYVNKKPQYSKTELV